MRVTKKLLSLLLCVLLLLGSAGCGTPAEDAAVPDPVPPAAEEIPAEPSAAEQYSQAAMPLRQAKNLRAELDIKKSSVTDTYTADYSGRQTLTLTGIGTDAFAADIKESRDFNGYGDTLTEYYKDGTLYIDAQGNGRFQGAVAQEDFLAGLAPAVLLDESLYADITAEETYSGITLTFAAPSAAESWALPEGSELLQAEGTAWIGFDGSLSKTRYTAEYLLNGVTVSLDVTSNASVWEGASLALPDTAGYTQVDSIEAIRLYSAAVLQLAGMETASATTIMSTFSQAAEYYLSTQTAMRCTGSGSSYASDIQYTASLSDGVQIIDTLTQTETFTDGVYTCALNGGAAEPQEDITAGDMQSYLLDVCCGGLPALEYITAAEAGEIGGLLYLELTPNEDWGLAMEDEVSLAIFGDDAYLDGYASAYRTHTGSCWLALDPATGFPTAAGSAFAGIHTIDGTEYAVGKEVTHSYRLGDPAVYEGITGEALPENPPETPATPLLYHVTGTDGQEMYLMGTIHVGDARTAFLPEEVYSALESADALAVECDAPAFEQAMRNDPQLAAQISAIYLNEGGAATKTLLDEDVYNRSVKLLKACGGYNSGMEYMNPAFWSSSIESFYLTLGTLHAEKGADVRLLKLAAEQNKEILEVESAMFQLQMLSDFSPALQARLLEGTLETTVAEYCAEARALYELWCAGDETALRAAVDEAPVWGSGEDAALYQEYLDAVIIRRNEAMLQAAAECLESGDTVFYAVGLAHLLQENGLVDALRDAGYTVEQVQYGS